MWWLSEKREREKNFIEKALIDDIKIEINVWIIWLWTDSIMIMYFKIIDRLKRIHD